MTTQHTPTPWRIENGEIFSSEPVESSPIGVIYRTEAWTSGEPVEHEDQENAAFIVKACNAHEDLYKGIMAACQMISERYNSEEINKSEKWEIIEKAIAKARGE